MRYLFSNTKYEIFCSDRYLLKQPIHTEISTEYTFIMAFTSRFLVSTQIIKTFSENAFIELSLIDFDIHHLTKGVNPFLLTVVDFDIYQ